MARAQLIEDREFERVYRIYDGRLITLKIDDEQSQITFWDEDGNQLGNDYDFHFIQDDMNYNKYLLARMYSPIKKVGLGRAAIEFFIEMTDGTIYTRPHDGQKRDDGSHLTEDAPGFVLKMEKEGLITNNHY